MPLPQIAEDVVHERVGNEWVLVNMTTNQIYALNETGALFWELLVEGKPREEIEAALGAEFDVDGGVLAREIDELLDCLAREGMVVPAA